MKKTSFAAVSVFMILAMLSLIAVPAQCGNNNPNKLWGAPTFVMNMLGKKADWSGTPDYDSNRHTMFIPEDVSEFLTLYPQYLDTGKGVTGPDLRIYVEQGEEFAITDPNMFDDGHCNLTIGSGYYEVYFVALGKPGKEAHLEGWIYNVTADEYLLKIGEVKVSHNGRPDWKSASGMFYLEYGEVWNLLQALGWAGTWDDFKAQFPFVHEDFGVWVFDFINWLATQTGCDYLYLWRLVSSCKHIQIRFYKIHN
ncbi:MAG: hypothetical protein ACETV1_05745 [Candidatus Bathyarchaeia archaeon]